MRTALRAALAAVLLSAGVPAAATAYRLLSVEELAAAADIAFHGTVTGVSVSLRDGDPWTAVTFAVDELLLDPGDDDGQGADGRELTLEFLGGESGGVRLDVALMPEFTEGEEVLLLAYEGRHYSPVAGFRQGLWRLSEGGRWLSETGEEFPLADDEDSNPDPEAAVTELRRLLEDR